MPIIGLVAAGLGAAGGIASAVIGSQASSHAAETQATAANNATAEQAQAQQNAINAQMSMFNTVQSNLAPYNQAGQSAISQLAGIFGFGPSTGAPNPLSPLAAIYGLGPGGTGTPNASAATSQLTNFPGYQFGLNQGTQALDRSAASKGLLLSGAQLQDAQKFGQGYAEQQGWAPYVSGLTNYANTVIGGLQSGAGLGENAAAGVGNAAVATGSGIANSNLTGAAQQAGSILAAGQASAAGTVAGANQITSAIGGLTGSGPNSISNLISSYGNIAGTSALGGPASSDAGFNALVGL